MCFQNDLDSFKPVHDTQLPEELMRAFGFFEKSVLPLQKIKLYVKIFSVWQRCSLSQRWLAQHENAQQSVHLTLGILRQSQAVFTP